MSKNSTSIEEKDQNEKLRIKLLAKANDGLESDELTLEQLSTFVELYTELKNSDMTR